MNEHSARARALAKTLIRGTGALLLAAALFAAKSLSAAPPEKLAVTYVKPPFNVPSMVERHLGLFAKRTGLPVEYLTLRNGPDQVRALAAGDIQFLPAAGSTSVFMANAQGADFKILSVFARSPQSFRILAPKGSPLRRPADLRGKRIAGPRGTILHELLAAWLAQDGMTVRDVQFQNMNIAAAAAALTAGKVDAALITGFPAWKLTQAGYKVLRDGQGIVGGEVLTVTTGRMVREHPEIVRQFMAARRESLQWMKDHPDETLSIVMKELDLTRDEARAQMALYDFSEQIRREDLQGLQRTVDFMASQGMMARPADVSSMIAPF